ncbi:MAG: Rrf2 family transcriptional regulator [Nitrospirae bacterium]|nr:Rrf2 family transcriptional regulator [Nitrospirota bacterium]
MQITRETDYAISCILYMAKEPEKTYIVSELAKPHYLPESFLAKILQKLVKSGFVKSIRGMKGGFLLAKKPNEISLLDVVESIEGTIAINMCNIDDSKCAVCADCPVHPVWAEIKSDVESKLRMYDFETLSARRELMAKAKVSLQ